MGNLKDDKKVLIVGHGLGKSALIRAKEMAKEHGVELTVAFEEKLIGLDEVMPYKKPIEVHSLTENKIIGGISKSRQQKCNKGRHIYMKNVCIYCDTPQLHYRKKNIK